MIGSAGSPNSFKRFQRRKRGWTRNYLAPGEDHRLDRCEGTETRCRVSYHPGADCTRSALDLQSEAEFNEDSKVYFNFAEDRISVAGKIGYSASSLTVIRNAFHLALLWASTIDRQFKYPRFLLIDNIEDKGMTSARSRNLQNQIVSISSAMPAEHQIIFTTSMVDPKLDTSDLTVGDHYTFENKSLKMPAARPTLV